MSSLPIQKLFVDRSPKGLLLKTTTGEPVWPVFQPLDFTAIEDLCKKCGALPTEVEGLPGTGTGKTGIVAYYPSHLEEAASLYGHLTNRDVLPFENDLSTDGTLVLLTTYELLNYELLERVRSITEDGVPVGIVCINERERVHSQILYYAATAYLSGPGSNKSVFFTSASSIDLVDGGNMVIAGNMSSRETIQSIMKDSEPLKMIMTHSDGIDAFFGRQLSMCGIRDILDDLPRPLPQCVESGWCHRQDMLVSEAVFQERLLSPTVLNAWILFWGVCWGVHANFQLIHPQWSITKQFLDVRAAPAIVTSWSVEILNPELFLMFAIYASNGLPVGEIVNRLVTSSIGKKSQIKLCVLGDPLVRLYPRAEKFENPGPDPNKEELPLRPTPEKTGDLAKLQFLNYVIERDATKGSKFEIAEAVATANNNLIEYKAAESDIIKIHSLLGAYISLSGPVMLTRWMSGASYSPLRSEGPRDCSWCWPEKRNEVRQFAGHIFGLPRQFSLCPLCGIVEDCPEGSALKVFVDEDNTLRVEGFPAEASPWIGGIIVMPEIQSKHILIPWQSDSKGQPVETMRLEQPLPDLHIYIGVYFMFGLDLYLLTRRGRGPNVK